ncbi:MAG: hypothetical protein K0R67_3870 [Paenibacillus sp.]|nr:hypothetical protein [Paenibacillus sp.]
MLMLIPTIIIVTIVLVGLVGTLLIGFSKENAKTNTGYSARTNSNWARLVALYVLSAIVLVVILIIVVKYII